MGVLSGHGIKMPWTPALYISSLVLSLVAIRTENTLINFKNYVDEVISKEKVSLMNKENCVRSACVLFDSISLSIPLR